MEPADVTPRPVDPARRARPEPLVDAPAFLGDWRWRALLAVVLTLPFFVPIPRELQYHLVVGAFGDRLHVVLLGGVACFLYWYGPLRGRLWSAAITAAATGGAIELLQLLVGRHALWHDFRQDLVGIGIAVGFFLWRGRGSRAGFALMAALVLLVPWQMRDLPAKVEAVEEAAARFPLLGDFEDSREAILWETDYDATIDIVPAAPGPGHILRVETDPIEKWPGASMFRFPRDWTGYDRLVVDVRAEADGLDFVRGGIILVDWEGRRQQTWKTWRNWFTPQWRTIEVPLDELRLDSGKQDLDLTDVISLKVYLNRPSAHTVLEIDNVRLE